MNIKFTIILIFFITFPAFSQESKYTLVSINYDIVGITQPFFLEKKLKLSIGQTFDNLEKVTEFEKKVNQDLENLRIYKDLKIKTRILGSNVYLFIYLDEAWQIIPLGFPKFNSETGGRVSMKLFWYNNFGTLTNTTIQGGVNIMPGKEIDEFEINSWDGSIETTGLYLFGKYFDVSYIQALKRESKESKMWSYHNSKLELGTDFPIVGDLSYNPVLSIGSRYNYKPVDNTISQGEIITSPLRIDYKHGFSVENINWLGNFREGYDYGINNTISLQLTEELLVKPTTSFDLSGSFYKPLGTLPIAIGFQLSGFLSLNEEILGLGKKIRGIKSGELYGYYGVFINTNIYIRAFKVEKVVESIISPHFDFGITDYQIPHYGTGADIILYADRFKSMAARGSISWDLTEFKPENFQIDVTGSLFF